MVHAGGSTARKFKIRNKEAEAKTRRSTTLMKPFTLANLTAVTMQYTRNVTEVTESLYASFQKKKKKRRKRQK